MFVASSKVALALNPETASVGFSLNRRAAAVAQASAPQGDFHLPSGWWLLPSVVGGASIWIWVLASVFG